jgi:hypothetical protein
MSKAASNFRRTDVKRAIQAVESAGLTVGRVELQGGKIVLFPDKGAVADPQPQDSLDNWMAKRAHSIEGN